jgi:hypothetical protein
LGAKSYFKYFCATDFVALNGQLCERFCKFIGLDVDVNRSARGKGRIYDGFDFR